MTVFDPQTDRYLDGLGDPAPDLEWGDVLRRARRRRVAGAIAATGAAIGVALAAVVPGADVGGRSILDKAEAAMLAPVRAVDGKIEHIRVAYRTGSGDVFIEHETWISADGGWCRRTVEGLPDGSAPDTRLTECHSPDGVVELYLPATGEILRAPPGAPPSGDAAAPGDGKRAYRISPDGKIEISQDGRTLTPAEVEALALQERERSEGAEAGTAPDWLREDIVEAFRRDAVREAGTMTLDGRVYAKLVTADGRDTVLVDPATGEGVAWIPSPNAFGVPTTVVRSRQTLPDDAGTRRSLSLTSLHPDATIRAVSTAELEQAKGAQFPRG
jgi:hypothetical protein